ncbi:FAD/NAD(P)-binding domain-containing protein, partial [Zopfia rhizophila CBS 207.26]
MQIIIIGAGISGITTYLFLKKYLEPKHSIYIYEKRSNILSNQYSEGAGLGIMPNGMRVLNDLDTNLKENVSSEGFDCENFLFHNKHGRVLGVQRANRNSEDRCISISRHGLWKCLVNQLERYGQPEDIVKIGEVEGVRWSEEKRKVLLTFTPKSQEEQADLVIGADGINSITRKSLFPESSLRYSGLAWVGGEVSTPLPKVIQEKRAWIFSPSQTGYFCYFSGGPASKNKVMWLSIYPEKDPSAERNLKEDLQNRYKDWADLTVHEVIDKADPKYPYPISTVPELPEWGRDGIVLLGDAVHTLSPTSGQGASQALEDAQTFSLLLAKSLNKCSSLQPKRETNA